MQSSFAAKVSMTALLISNPRPARHATTPRQIPMCGKSNARNRQTYAEKEKCATDPTPALRATTPFGANRKQNPICGKSGTLNRLTYSERSIRLNTYVIKAQEPTQPKCGSSALQINSSVLMFWGRPCATHNWHDRYAPPRRRGRKVVGKR